MTDPGHETTCRDVVAFLAAYLDGDLPPARRQEFEAHLALCPDCVAYLESYRETRRLGALAYSLDGPVPEDVPEALIEAILAARRR